MDTTREIMFRATREIKFRAWSKLGKFMFDVDGGGDNFDFYKNNRSFSELMQYTGLKDKNKKEIYEGDIIEIESSKDRGVVIFEEGCFVIKWFTTGYHQTLLFKFHPKIIGNIYENPELLKLLKGDSNVN